MDFRLEKLGLHDASPFNEELIPAEFNRERIKTFISDPEKIVRIHSTGASLEVVKKELEEGSQALKDLRDTYHIPMPDFEFVIGPYINESIPFVYILAQRVHGQNLTEITFSPDQKERAKEQLDALYSSLAQYFWDMYEEKRAFLKDITKLPQYVYGKKEGDSQDYPYLVDLDYFYHNDFSTTEGFASFFSSLFWLYSDIKEIEAKLGARLNEARRKFTQFLSSINRLDPHYDIIENIKAIHAL